VTLVNVSDGSAVDAWPWARPEIDRRLAELRAKRAQSWLRALVEQKLAERRAERVRMRGPVTLMPPPRSNPN
jgi:hypothetical protein